MTADNDGMPKTKRERIVLVAKAIAALVYKLESKCAAEAEWAMHELDALTKRIRADLDP